MKIEKRCPSYLKEFKCIGGKCTDSCCIGWDIDIDKVIFRQYHKVKDEEMKKLFQKHVHNNEYCQDEQIDYGKVKLQGEKRCPFLDGKNYCIIHAGLGEEYLSNVCTAFPRVLNKIDDYYEMSLDVSCPEAARIVLGRLEGIEFEVINEELGKHIVSSGINTKAANGLPARYFKEIRDLSIMIIKNRDLSINERMYILGEFINSLEDELLYNYAGVPKFIKEYKIDSVQDDYEENPISYVLQADFFKNIMSNLDVFKQVDSNSFKDYTKEVISGFKFSEYGSIGQHAEFYINAFKEYEEKYLEKNSYIFENYLVNYIYNNMFPFTETESIFDGYMMLLIRYSFIRFYLAGHYLFSKEESVDNMIWLIQAFSKSIGHHKTYLVNVLTYLKNNEFDNIEFAKIHLPK